MKDIATIAVAWSLRGKSKIKHTENVFIDFLHLKMDRLREKKSLFINNGKCTAHKNSD